jgi:hypothetical protein
MTGYRCAAFGALVLALAVSGCGGVPGGEPQDPGEAQIARLTGQGFTVISDDRSSGGPAVLRYQGSPAGVIACQSGGGRASATDQSGTATSSDGLYTVSQTGQVAAYLIVDPTGGLRGTYVNTLSRTVASGGIMVAKQLETIQFPPGGAGTFRNGVTCQAQG